MRIDLLFYWHDYATIEAMDPFRLITLIDAYAAAAGLSPHSAGRYAAGSGDFYGRLVAGHDLTTRRAARVAQWLSDHWPDGLEWPRDIPRPARTKDAA